MLAEFFIFLLKYSLDLPQSIDRHAAKSKKSILEAKQLILMYPRKSPREVDQRVHAESNTIRVSS